MTSCFRPLRRLAILCCVLAGLQTGVASAQDVKQQVTPCLVCHPASNVPENSPIPIIWGQNEGYVYLQLRDFKRATRASPSDGVMHVLAEAMTDAQMRSIAKYVAQQPWRTSHYNNTSSTEALRLRGAQLLAYGDCGACHFKNWQGYSANPRLRGQTPTYLWSTIDQFRNDQRGNSPGMSDLLRSYSEDDVKAISEYLSSVE